MLPLILVLALVFGQGSPTVRDPWVGKGELNVCWSETESGTIARRDLRDEAGRIIRTIYYSLSTNSPARIHWPLRREEIAERRRRRSSLGAPRRAGLDSKGDDRL